MKPDARRVYVFIALGLLFALFVGYGVWRVSTPDTVASHRVAKQAHLANHHHEQPPPLQAQQQEPQRQLFPQARGGTQE